MIMNNIDAKNIPDTRRIIDKVGMSLSLLCGIHCLIPYLFFFASFSWLSNYLVNEVFHVLMIFFSIAVVVFSLKNKKNISRGTIVQMLLGLFFLSVGVLNHVLHSDADIIVHQNDTMLENVFTLLGGLLLFIAHYKKARTCACEDINKVEGVKF